MAKLTVKPPEFFAWMRFDYHEPLIESLKQLPGARWSPQERCWIVPQDCLGAAKLMLQEHKTNASFIAHAIKPMPEPNPAPLPLYPYQQHASNLARQKNGLLINFETGLGKSAAAIDAAIGQHANGRKLILCPPGVVSVWQDELRRWAPEAAEPEVLRRRNSVDKWLSADAEWFIASYARLPAEFDPAAQPKFDAIILDESHNLKNMKSGRSKAAAAIRALNPDALCIETTATPIANTPKDLWHQLNLLRPSAYGNYYKFCARYCYTTHSQYGLSIEGLNDKFADELRGRLADCSVRVTKSEVAHLLPLFIVQSIKQRPERAELDALMQLTNEFVRGSTGRHEDAANSFYLASRGKKIDMAVEQVKLALEAGETHIFVFSYLRETARTLFKALEADYYIDGAMDAKERDAVLTRARGSRRAVTVATMKSLLEGKDLTWNSTAVYAELYYSPLVMIQSLGRFNRLSGTAPTRALLCVLEGTLDELVSRSVLEKVKDCNAVFRAGDAESKLERALGDTDDEDAFIERLKYAADSYVESEGGY